MVNPDSDAVPGAPRLGAGHRRLRARARPQPTGARPHSTRRVRPRARPAGPVLHDHDIAFVKWDMNRTLVQGSGGRRRRGHPRPDPRGLPAARRAALRGTRRSSSSRARAAAAASTSRCCAAPSGCGPATATTRSSARPSSAARRCSIPPEVMGAHIGPTRAHTTGRVAVAAVPGAHRDLGAPRCRVEPARARRAESAQALAAVIAVHKRFRPLLHGGDGGALRPGAQRRARIGARARRVRRRPRRGVGGGGAAHHRHEPGAAAAAAARGCCPTPPTTSSEIALGGAPAADRSRSCSPGGSSPCTVSSSRCSIPESGVLLHPPSTTRRNRPPNDSRPTVTAHSSTTSSTCAGSSSSATH